MDGEKGRAPARETPETQENRKSGRPNSKSPRRRVQAEPIDANGSPIPGTVRFTDAYKLTKRLRGKWHGTFSKARCPNHWDPVPLNLRDGPGTTILLWCPVCDQQLLRRVLLDSRKVYLDPLWPDDAAGGTP